MCVGGPMGFGSLWQRNQGGSLDIVEYIINDLGDE
jgi:hypothetical protein